MRHKHIILLSALVLSMGTYGVTAKADTKVELTNKTAQVQTLSQKITALTVKLAKISHEEDVLDKETVGKTAQEKDQRAIE